MSISENEFTMDYFNEGVENAESNEPIETTTEEVKAESKTESKTESESEKGLEAKEGENSGAESPEATKEYSPDYSYKVKDEQKEFPEFLRGVVKTKEQEEQVRDLLTRADAIETVKESRGRIESELNDYRQSVENKIYPVLDKIGEFDKANAVKDFKTAWELSDVDPTDIVDYMLMDEKLGDLVYKKVLDQIQLQDNGGPQALEAQRTAFREQSNSRALELKNQSLESRLRQIEDNTYNQSLEFVMSQHQDAASKFDSANGAGAFRNFVSDYSFMQRQKGNNISPADAVLGAAQMLGLSSGQATLKGNNELQQEQAKVASQGQKQPEMIPNIGTGSNVSMVQKSASTWDEWTKSIGNSF